MLMQKLEKLLDLAIMYLERELGQAPLPLTAAEPVVAAPRKRKEKAPAETIVPPGGPHSNGEVLMTEKEAEAKVNELVPLYIRRFKTSPEGVKAVQDMIGKFQKADGAPVKKLPELSHEQRVLLVTGLHAALKTADAVA